MIIQHNMASANTNRQLGINTGNLSKATEKLSSGYKINRAGDDAAGLSISEKMRGQIRGLDRASTNAQDGISLIQTAEGALQESHSILQRMRELVVQAANGTNSKDERIAIQKEIQELENEVDRIANQTEFNGMKLLNGDFSTDKLNLQVGANEGQAISFNIAQATMDKITENAETDEGDAVDNAGSSTAVSANITETATYTSISNTIATVDQAISKISEIRSNLGAMQNRLEHTITNADNTAENLQAAESRIRDVDMAEEMVTYSKYNILQQAAQSMLAQANQSTQGVLTLLR